MPWHVAKSKECDGSKQWAVIKDSDGSVVACHESMAKAMRQMRALYASEARKTLGKFNPNHKPSGSPDGGEFTSGPGSPKNLQVKRGTGKPIASHGGRVGVQSTLVTLGGRAMSNSEVGQTFERALVDKAAAKIGKKFGVPPHGRTQSSSGQGANTPIDVYFGDPKMAKGKHMATEVKTYHIGAEGKVCIGASAIKAKRQAAKKTGARELTVCQIVDQANHTVHVHVAEGFQGMRTKQRKADFSYKYTDAEFAKWHDAAGFNEAGRYKNAAPFKKADMFKAENSAADYIEGGPAKPGDVVMDINADGVEFFYCNAQGELTKDFPADDEEEPVGKDEPYNQDEEDEEDDEEPEVTVATGELIKSDDDKMQAFGWAYVVNKGDGEQVYDVSGEFVDKDEVHELEDAAYDFVLHSRDGGDWHSRTGVGTMIESVVFNDEKIEKMGLPDTTPRGWWVGFQIHDDKVWNLVKSGVYTAFSIHGSGHKTKIEPPANIKKSRSLIDRYHEVRKARHG